MARAIFTGDLVLGELIIPIKIYKGYTQFKIDGSLFEPQTETPINHPDTITLDDETLIIEFDDIDRSLPVDNVNVGVPLDTRKELLGSNNPITVIGSVPMSELDGMYLSEVMMESFFVAPGQPTKSGLPLTSDALHCLLSKLRTRKKALLIRLGINGMNRHAYLLSNGRLAVAYYQEEIRETIPWEGNDDATYLSYIQHYLDDHPVPRQSFSLRVIQERVSSFISALSKQDLPTATKKPRTSPKKKAKEKTNA